MGQKELEVLEAVEMAQAGSTDLTVDELDRTILVKDIEYMANVAA